MRIGGVLMKEMADELPPPSVELLHHLARFAERQTVGSHQVLDAIFVRGDQPNCEPPVARQEELGAPTDDDHFSPLGGLQENLAQPGEVFLMGDDLAIEP